MSQENIQELTLRRASLQSLNQDMENANGAVEDYIEHLRENGQEKESSELSTRLKQDEEFNKNFKLAIVETASLLAIIFAKTKDVVVTKDLIKKSKEESFTNMKKMFLEASEKDIAQFSKEFLILSKSETDREIYDMKVHHLENVKGEDFQMYEEENLSNDNVRKGMVLLSLNSKPYSCKIFECEISSILNNEPTIYTRQSRQCYWCFYTD